jgi:alkylation response protein AidB-like acyl-CoA dehydrogenase
LATPQRGGP